MTDEERSLGSTWGVRLPRYVERAYEAEAERDGISIAALIRRACMRDIAARTVGTISTTNGLLDGRESGDLVNPPKAMSARPKRQDRARSASGVPS